MANQPLGLQREQHLSRTGPGSKLRGRLHGRPDDRRTAPAARAREDLTGRDADPEGDRSRGADLGAAIAHLEGRPGGTQGVVLAGDHESKCGRHAVVVGVVDGSPVSLCRSADDVLG